jgi:hypothetical protein
MTILMPLDSPRFVDVFPELANGRSFTPSELHELTTVSPQTQRLWRHRNLVPFDRRDPESREPVPYSWGKVLQYALMLQISQGGIDLAIAGQAAAEIGPTQFHPGLLDHDFCGDAGPLFLFCRPARLFFPLQVNWSRGPEFEFEPESEPVHPSYGEDFGFWINYSAVQRRVVDAYKKMRG